MMLISGVKGVWQERKKWKARPLPWFSIMKFEITKDKRILKLPENFLKIICKCEEIEKHQDIQQHFRMQKWSDTSKVLREIDF